jgi:hypothetical protein
VKSKRLWKKYGLIERLERNNGDIKFATYCAEEPENPPNRDKVRSVGDRWVFPRQTFEDLASAEGDLDTWFKEWWPLQVKSTRRA